MKIRTRYNKEDLIYFIHDRSIQKGVIENIIIIASEKIIVSYQVQNDFAEGPHDQFITIPHADAFDTVEKLVEKLVQRFENSGITMPEEDGIIY